MNMSHCIASCCKQSQCRGDLCVTEVSTQPSFYWEVQRSKTGENYGISFTLFPASPAQKFKCGATRHPWRSWAHYTASNLFWKHTVWRCCLAWMRNSYEFLIIEIYKRQVLGQPTHPVSHELQLSPRNKMVYYLKWTLKWHLMPKCQESGTTHQQVWLTELVS